jgi:hypothetical protein
LTENSKALNWMSSNEVHSVGWSDSLFSRCVEWVLWPKYSKQTVGWTDGTGIGSSDALGFGYSMGHDSGLKHRTIWHLDHQFIRRLHLNHTEMHQVNCFSTGWTDAWIGMLSGSPDGLIQIIQYRPECEVFSTGWSDRASVYSFGALSGFLGSMAILRSVSDRMIQRFAWETIGSSDGTTFSGNLF